jgi:hypothetical protein
MRYASARDAFKETGGVVAAEPVVETTLAWLVQIGARLP